MWRGRGCYFSFFNEFLHWGLSWEYSGDLNYELWYISTVNGNCPLHLLFKILFLFFSKFLQHFDVNKGWKGWSFKKPNQMVQISNDIQNRDYCPDLDTFSVLFWNPNKKINFTYFYAILKFSIVHNLKHFDIRHYQSSVCILTVIGPGFLCDMTYLEFLQLLW